MAIYWKPGKQYDKGTGRHIKVRILRDPGGRWRVQVWRTKANQRFDKPKTFWANEPEDASLLADAIDEYYEAKETRPKWRDYQP